MTGTSSRGWIARRMPRLMLLLALASGAAAALPNGASAAANPCALPDTLLDAGLLQDAAARYHAVERAASDPAAAPACVKAGLRKVRKERHLRARQISAEIEALNDEVEARRRRWKRRHGDLAGFERRVVVEQTRRRIVRAARVGLDDEIPHVVAHGIARKDGGLYGLEIARVLKRAHYLVVAEAVVAATVAAHPAVVVPAGLRSLGDQRRQLADTRDARQQIKAAVAYSEAGLDDEADAAVKRALTKDPDVDVPDEVNSPQRNQPFWNRLRGQIGPWLRTIAEILIVGLFAAALLLLIPRLWGRFRVRLAIKPFTGGPEDDKQTGPATSAAVRENFGRLAENGGSRLKFVSSSGQSFAAVPSEVAEIYAPAGAILTLLSLVDRLFPSRIRSVTGDLRPRDPERGGGLTITFGRRYGKVFDEQTLWEGDYGRPIPVAGADPCQSAYDHVALPAAAWLTFAAAKRTLLRRLGVRRPFKVLGTDEWHSYAYFAVGADRQAANKVAEARHAYHQALGRDAGNHGAAFNLAVLDLQSASLPLRRQALTRLEALSTAIGDDKTYDLWYRVRYAEAVARLDPPLGYPPVEARRFAVELCSAILEQRWRLICLFPKIADERRQLAFLGGVLPSALLVLASALQQEGRADDPDRTLTMPLLRQRLRDLHSDDSATARAAFDAAVTHPSLVAFVAARWPLNPDALYNRACYDARVARMPPQTSARWDAVEQRLHEALRRGGPVAAACATVDPALERYRLDPDRRARLLQVAREVGASV